MSTQTVLWAAAAQIFKSIQAYLAEESVRKELNANPLRIFISYQSTDRARASRLCSRLAREDGRTTRRPDWNDDIPSRSATCWIGSRWTGRNSDALDRATTPRHQTSGGGVKSASLSGATTPQQERDWTDVRPRRRRAHLRGTSSGPPLVHLRQAGDGFDASHCAISRS